MLSKPSTIFNRLLDRIQQMPIVDCHEHLMGPRIDLAQAAVEPILAIVSFYFISDLWAAGATNEEIELLQSHEATTNEKWPVFSRLWAATEHTAYARVTKLVLKEVYGIDKLTRDSLQLVAEQLATRDEARYLEILADAGIKAVIADILFPPPWEQHIWHYSNPVLKEFLEGQFELPEMWHPVFPLPAFHEVRFREFIDHVGSLTGMNITSLGEYEEAVFEVMRQARERGVIALKDQSSYRRWISFDLPTQSDAERLFNKLMIDPRNQLAWPEVKPMEDYLFHCFMRFARELRMPVQIHTGHMAGIRNRVDKANAADFASVLELHSEVQFDLFHGNWPYMGDLLFLGKNYPNVSIDLCWVNMIDPIYARQLLERAVMTMPHTKIFGFGGDYFLTPEFSVAHLTLARQVIASALANLVETGWLEEEQAIDLAAAWLHNNPNTFYQLGLPPYDA